MKKRGFTLIELMCSMAILSMFIACTLPIIKPMLKIAKEQEHQTIIYLTEDILNYGKLYSKYNEKSISGTIKNNKIILSHNGESIRQYELPNGYEFYSSNSDKTFTINNSGDIGLSTTIYLRYKGKDIGNISIPVGRDILNVN